MEEHVGQIWHRWISGVAQQHHPDAAINLEDIKQQAGIVFRSLGGDGGLKVEACTQTEHGSRRTLAQRLAGTNMHIELAWRDEQTLRLPSRITCFESRELNRELYLWLSALAAAPVHTEGVANWLADNATRTNDILTRFPGARSRYQRLLNAHLAVRPAPNNLQPLEALQEQLIRHVLSNPGEPVSELPERCRPPMPVPLWLHPSPPVVGTVPAKSVKDEDMQDEVENEGPSQAVELDKRQRGERVDTPDGRDGLLAFRLESMFSRAEYVAVDRSTEENEDEDSKDALEDLELLSMASGGKRPKSRLKFDLDLPSEEYDDVVLGPGIWLPEWDYRKQVLVADQCCIVPMQSSDNEPRPLPERLVGKAQRIRQMFELVQSQRQWLRAQPDGSEIDTDAVISTTCERHLGRASAQSHCFKALRSTQRDFTCLVLADLSMSTDAYINQDQRVIDVIRDSLLLFSEALRGSGDQFALYGFSSRRREHVRFNTLKTFEESHDENTIARILDIRPGYYTRMGTAIRHATELLGQQRATQKLLLVLTDGKPNDLDRYEGRYGVEDTRHAVRACAASAVKPFCVTIDEKAHDYLPYIFGQNAFTRVKHVNELPVRLPALYAQLTKQS